MTGTAIEVAAIASMIFRMSFSPVLCFRVCLSNAAIGGGHFLNARQRATED
jgi:hypothetical protein